MAEENKGIPVMSVFRDVGRVPRFPDRGTQRELSLRISEGDFLRVRIPVRMLVATQPFVNADFREAAARLRGDGFDLPAVVKHQGGFYVLDGHHRLMAAGTSGLGLAEIRLFDLDGDTQLDFPLLDQLPDPFDRPETDQSPSIEL